MHCADGQYNPNRRVKQLQKAIKNVYWEVMELYVCESLSNGTMEKDTEKPSTYHLSGGACHDPTLNITVAGLEDSTLSRTDLRVLDEGGRNAFLDQEYGSFGLKLKLLRSWGAERGWGAEGLWEDSADEDVGVRVTRRPAEGQPRAGQPY